MPVGELPLRCDSPLATPISLHLHRLYAKRLTGNAKCRLGWLPLVENRLCRGRPAAVEKRKPDASGFTFGSDAKKDDVEGAILAQSGHIASGR
jgi:hypothetical protein